MTARRLLAGLAVAALVAGGACSSDKSSSERPSDSAATTVSTTVPPLQRDGDVYAVPDPLPDGPPGELLAVTDGRRSTVFPDATRRELLYRSTDFDDRDVPVSGALLVPDGTPPDDGWPVISWGHGTTGVADQCAPSASENLFYNEYAQQVRGFLAAGYAVAASDYVGLGTPGVHSYSVGVDLGNALVDIVAAARQAEPSLSSTYFVVGHSEGGQAVLFATRSAARQPDLRLAAAVAIAPSSHLELALPAIAAGELPADVVYGLYLLAGLGRVDPSVDEIAAYLGPDGADLGPAVLEDECLLDTLVRVRDRDVASIFAIAPDEMSALSTLLGDVGDPDREPTVGPLRIVQGSTDRDIPAPITQELVASLEAQGSDVSYEEYPGLDHDLVLGPSLCDTLEWMHTRGGPEATRCVAEPTDMT